MFLMGEGNFFPRGRGKSQRNPYLVDMLKVEMKEGSGLKQVHGVPGRRPKMGNEIMNTHIHTTIP